MDLEACADSSLPELERLAKTISTWWPEILAFIHSGVSNASSEPGSTDRYCCGAGVVHP